MHLEDIINRFDPTGKGDFSAVDPSSEAGKQIDNLTNLPSIETLPKNIQDLVESLDGLEPFEAMALIRQASLDIIEFRDEAATTDVVVGLEAVLEKGFGDCDDQSIFMAAMLEYAGFDPSKIAIVAGDMVYSVWPLEDSNGNTAEPYEEKIAHNLVFVEHDGQVYAIDSNNMMISTVNEHMFISAEFPDQDGNVAADGSVELVNIEMIIKMNGEMYDRDRNVSLQADPKPTTQEIMPSLT